MRMRAECLMSGFMLWVWWFVTMPADELNTCAKLLSTHTTLEWKYEQLALSTEIYDDFFYIWFLCCCFILSSSLCKWLFMVWNLYKFTISQYECVRNVTNVSDQQTAFWSFWCVMSVLTDRSLVSLISILTSHECSSCHSFPASDSPMTAPTSQLSLRSLLSLGGGGGRLMRCWGWSLWAGMSE